MGEMSWPCSFQITKINSARRNKVQEIFRFCPFQVTKVNPTGNIQKGIKCPQARSGHRIVADNGNVYSFGGYKPSSDEPDLEDLSDVIWIDSCLLFKELWRFNIATKTWKKLKCEGDMPEELASPAVLLVDECLVVFGGTGVPFGTNSSNSVHLCDLRTNNTWIELPTVGELPQEQYGQAIAIEKGKLYAVGGTTGYEYSMDVHCLNFSTQEWTELKTTSQPQSRYRHEMAIENKKLFVFGGGTASESFSLKKVPIFNIEDHTWSTSPSSENFPKARRCHSCVQIGSDVYIAGGQSGDTIFADVWKFNLKTMEWSKLPCSLPQPVYFHSAAITTEGQMFIFGGVTSTSLNTRTNDMYSVWVTIPSLKEMCWQSILHYIPYINNIDKSYLNSIGIPQNFLDRVDFVNKEF